MTDRGQELMRGVLIGVLFWTLVSIGVAALGQKVYGRIAGLTTHVAAQGSTR